MLLVEEMSFTSEVHSYVRCLRSRNDFLVANTATWLNYRFDASINQNCQSICKWEERIRRSDRTCRSLAGS
jgi:hypothetical protein